MARIAFRTLLLRERFLFPIVEAMVEDVSLELCGRDTALTPGFVRARSSHVTDRHPLFVP